MGIKALTHPPTERRMKQQVTTAAPTYEAVIQWDGLNLGAVRSLIGRRANYAYSDASGLTLYDTRRSARSVRPGDLLLRTDENRIEIIRQVVR